MSFATEQRNPLDAAIYQSAARRRFSALTKIPAPIAFAIAVTVMIFVPKIIGWGTSMPRS